MPVSVQVPLLLLTKLRDVEGTEVSISVSLSVSLEASVVISDVFVVASLLAVVVSALLLSSFFEVSEP